MGVQNKAWYKRWWGIIIAIVFLPFFIVWYTWSESNWHKGIKITVTAVVAIVLLSWPGDSGNIENTSKNTSDDNNGIAADDNQEEYRFAERADKQDKDIEVLPGEAATLSGIKMVVKDVDYKTSLGQFSNAEDGKTFMVVEVVMENVSDRTRSYNGLDFRIQTASGQVLDKSLLESVEPRLGAADLVQGGKVTGKVVFEVPVESGHQYIIWKPSWASDRVIVRANEAS